jgi:hypothetical protein
LLSVIMHSVIMLSVTMLNVVAPLILLVYLTLATISTDPFTK